MTVVTVWYWDLSSDNDKYDIDFSLWEDEIFSGKNSQIYMAVLYHWDLTETNLHNKSRTIFEGS